ncbi:MAG: tetratricopeptide repeat protein [bacterium]
MGDLSAATSGLFDVSEETELLRLLIEETDASVLAFGLYRSIVDRETAVRDLKARLKTPIVEFTLSKQQKNPIALLYSIPADERRCVFFYDVEDALPEAAGYVNIQREALTGVPHAVVFWIREYGMRELMLHAPDFWSWHSGVFDFQSDRKRPEFTAMQAILPDQVYFKDRSDLESRLSLYQGLIKEYSQEEKPDEAFLARLHLKLGVVFYHLTQFGESEKCAQKSMEYAHVSGDRETESAAVYVLGILAEERWQFEKAEQKYRESAKIAEEIRNEQRIADCYHQMGNIALRKLEFDKAEKWYAKALEIRERRGLERDAATDYHELGVIARERGQIEIAEQYLKKALEIRERIGLQIDAATDYHELGIIARERGHLEAAEEWHKRALEIRERIGLERDAATDYHELGIIARERRQFDAAQEWLEKALNIRERIGLERDAATDYHELGIVARDRGQYNVAEQYSKKAMEIRERTRLERSTAGG